MASFQCRLSDGEQVICTISHVVTCHQTNLRLDCQTRDFSHRAIHPDKGETLALTWSSFPGFCLIVASDEDWPENGSSMRKGGWIAEFVPLALIPMPDRKVALKPYGESCFLTAEFGTGRICSDRHVISDWELLHFKPWRGVLTDPLSDFANLFAEMLQRFRDPEALLHVLLSFPTSLQSQLLDLLHDLLAPSELAQFVEFFKIDAQAGNESVVAPRESILTALEHGDWINEGLNRLCEWEAGRHVSLQKAPERYDFFGFMKNTQKGSPFYRGSWILSEARRMVKPKRTLALLATARDEGVYLLEWIAHHRRIGVEQFFIYTNNLTDGSDKLLQRLAEAGEIVWVDNTGASPTNINMQDKAYNHALMMLPELLDYRWCLVVDLDEMVLPDASFGYRLPPLLAAREREGAEAIAMSWRVFTSNGNLTWSPELSASRFVETEKHPLIKTAFRTHLFSGASAHHPLCRKRKTIPYLTIDGEAHKSQDLSDYEINFASKPSFNAFVCHYNVRSLEEYVWKFARGENDNSGVLQEKHFRYNNPGIFELFTSRFSLSGAQPALAIREDVLKEIQRLSRLPGVAQASNDVEDCFRAQCGAFVEQSAQIMIQDDRIAPEVQEKWRALVGDWRRLRRGS